MPYYTYLLSTYSQSKLWFQIYKTTKLRKSIWLVYEFIDTLSYVTFLKSLDFMVSIADFFTLKFKRFIYLFRHPTVFFFCRFVKSSVLTKLFSVMTSREVDQLTKPTFRSRYAHTPWNRGKDRWTQSNLLVKWLAGLWVGIRNFFGNCTCGAFAIRGIRHPFWVVSWLINQHFDVSSLGNTFYSA